MHSDDHRPGWRRARDVLGELVRQQSAPEAKIEVGRVVRIGDGVSRDVFAGAVTVDPDPHEISDSYAVLLPLGAAPPGGDDRTRGELRILDWLLARDLPFRVPKPFGALPVQHGLAFVRSFIRGVPLDLRVGRQPSLRPWQVVGEIAAAVHGLDAASLPAWLGGYASRREHAVERLAALAELEAPEAKDAHAWAMEHLPPPGPSSLLHGDLLGQNILIDPGEERPFAVIDWEYATRGDPAYDLAIVTRGARQPFQQAGGLGLLLEAYAEAGGEGVTQAHVRVHELALGGEWYREALRRRPGEGERPEEALALIRRVLRMARAG